MSISNLRLMTHFDWLHDIADHVEGTLDHVQLAAAYTMKGAMSQTAMTSMLKKRAEYVRQMKKDLLDWGFVEIEQMRQGRQQTVVVTPVPRDGYRFITSDEMEEILQEKTPVRHPSDTRPTPVPRSSPGTRVPSHIEERVPAHTRAHRSVTKGNLTPSSEGGVGETTTDDYKSALTQNQDFEGGVAVDAFGRLILVNGTKQFWLDEFGGNERRLQHALMQVAGRLQKNNSKPLASQVSGHLAQIVSDKIDRDERYEKGVLRNQAQQKRSKPRSFGC